MKQNKKQGKKNEVGAYGEQIAAKYLKKQGFTIVDTNWLNVLLDSYKNLYFTMSNPLQHNDHKKLFHSLDTASSKHFVLKDQPGHNHHILQIWNIA